MFLFGRRVFALLVVFGSLAVPRGAGAYCRTTTQPLPQDYSPTRGCYTDGLYLFWRNACVSYSINASASASIPFDEAKRVIDDSFGTWMGTTCADTGQAAGIAVSNAGSASCEKIGYNADGPNQNLIVFRDDGWPYLDPNSTLGLTTVTFNSETGEIYDADMEINSSRRNLSTTDRVPANGFDLASVVTHEAGHFFGLAHATSMSATMYASYKPGTDALRTLSDDDVAGLCAIYPSTTARIVTPVATQSQAAEIEAIACDPTPRHGLTSKCAVPKAKQSSCAATAGASSAWETSVAALGAIGLLAVRRRRRRA